MRDRILDHVFQLIVTILAIWIAFRFFDPSEKERSNRGRFVFSNFTQSFDCVNIKNGVPRLESVFALVNSGRSSINSALFSIGNNTEIGDVEIHDSYGIARRIERTSGGNGVTEILLPSAIAPGDKILFTYRGETDSGITVEDPQYGERVVLLLPSHNTDYGNSYNTDYIAIHCSDGSKWSGNKNR